MEGSCTGFGALRFWVLGLGFWVRFVFFFGAGLFGTRPRFANAFKSSSAEKTTIWKLYSSRARALMLVIEQIWELEGVYRQGGIVF